MAHTTILKKALALAAVLTMVPALAFSQQTLLPAEILHNGCDVTPTLTTHNFTVRNNSLTRICQVVFTPMAGTGCPILAAAGPPAWSTTVNPDGSALWAAPMASNCVDTGTSKTNFSFSVGTTGTCCYVVEFFSGNGTLLYHTTRCCNCGPISVDQESWGQVKSKYQD